MTDFLITMMTLYPWFTWLLVAFAAVGVGYGSLWLAGGVALASAWMGYRRQVWRAKAAVRRSLTDGSLYGGECAVCADRDAMMLEAMAAGDDPPEYQHPDGDDYGPEWDGPPDDWSPAAEWGEHPGRAMGSLAAILIRAHEIGMLNDDDQLPDGPPRCNNRDCYAYGCHHEGACDVAPTMPAACYTDPGGPAGPPVPWSGYEDFQALHPASQRDLEAAGFRAHDTVADLLDSTFTGLDAREVQAMITDGVIGPEGQE